MVLPTFTCDYGYNISLGRNVFINYHCIFLDCAPITIGDDVQIGPAVQLYTAQHPIDAKVRRSGWNPRARFRIGSDVWIGGGALVLPGVTIGDRSIVGAGSVVVHDVPPDSLVVGQSGPHCANVRVNHDMEKNTLMEKPADIDHPIHDLLQRRWSPRAFSERMVEAENIAKSL